MGKQILSWIKGEQNLRAGRKPLEENVTETASTHFLLLPLSSPSARASWHLSQLHLPWLQGPVCNSLPKSPLGPSNLCLGEGKALTWFFPEVHTPHPPGHSCLKYHLLPVGITAYLETVYNIILYKFGECRESTYESGNP